MSPTKNEFPPQLFVSHRHYMNAGSKIQKATVPLVMEVYGWHLKQLKIHLEIQLVISESQTVSYIPTYSALSRFLDTGCEL